MKRSIPALLAVLVLAAGLAAGVIGADAHPGHPQKKLFGARWYQTQMDLSTSQLGAGELMLCDTYPSCLSKWGPPVTGAIQDWNFQNDTVRFQVQPGFNFNFDINAVFWDTVFDSGDPNILGIALIYDSTGDWCGDTPDTCIIRWGEAHMGDDGHSGPFGNQSSRHATIVHELGHLISLRHESVNANESVRYECGFDNTGVIPVSIMSYDCINPVAVGGAGLVFVQAWDVCGVNHAYPDGAYGFSGCPPVPTPVPTPTPSPVPTATPTPAPTPVPAGPNAWGNVDCGAGIGSVDALKVLRFTAGLSVTQTEPCTNIGDQHPIVLTHDQGDIDCNGVVSSVDSLKLLRFAAGLSVSQTQPCPTIGLDP